MAKEEMSLKQLQRRVAGLRQTNSHIIAEIESYGGGVELSVARIENIIGMLLEKGVITEYEAWKEQESWELRLRPQIRALRDKLAEQGKLQPPGKGLYLPPSAQS